MMSDCGFKRIHKLPKKWFKHTIVFDETPRGEYIRKASEARYYKRTDCVDVRGLLIGEIGRIDSFRFVETP